MIRRIEQDGILHQFPAPQGAVAGGIPGGLARDETHRRQVAGALGFDLASQRFLPGWG